MSSEDIENGLNSPLVFQDDPLRFNCGAPTRRTGDPVPKTREIGGFIDDKMFAMERDRFFTAQGTDFRRNVYGDCSGRRDPPHARNWSGNGTPSGGESDDDEDDDEDDDIDDDAEVEGLVGVGGGNKRNSNAIGEINNNNGGGGNLAGVANGKAQHHSPYGMNEEKFASLASNKMLMLPLTC